MPSTTPTPSLLERLLAPIHGFRRFFRRRVLVHRRPLGALAAVGAVVAGYTAYTSPPPAGTPVWVAAHDVAAGSVIARGDLHQVRFREGSTPTGRIGAPTAAVGRTLAVGLSTGQPVTTDLFVGDPLLRGRAGVSAVPVRVTDPSVAGLLRVGDTVDLVATDAEHGEVHVVPRAEVMALPSATREAPEGISGRLVVFGVPAAEASNVASASAKDLVTVIWSG